MGGKNPIIVMPDANLEQAAEITLSGAMKYSVKNVQLLQEQLFQKK